MLSCFILAPSASAYARAFLTERQAPHSSVRAGILAWSVRVRSRIRAGFISKLDFSPVSRATNTPPSFFDCRIENNSYGDIKPGSVKDDVSARV